MQPQQFRTVSRTVTTPIFNGGAARITIDQVEEQVPVMFPPLAYPLDQELVNTDEAVYGNLEEYDQPVDEMEMVEEPMDYAPASVEEEEYVPFEDTMEPEEDMIDDPSMEFDQDYL